MGTRGRHFTQGQRDNSHLRSCRFFPPLFFGLGSLLAGIERLHLLHAPDLWCKGTAEHQMITSPYLPNLRINLNHFRLQL